jgi:hypothetical protein
VKLRKACELRDVQHIMDLYPTLLEARVLDRQDTRRIAQALHTRARQKSKTSDMFPFVQQLVADIRSGALDPHPYAFVHLLGIYKDYKRFNEGHEVWQWLVQRDDTYVSQAAYGAAIELMAYGGISTLPELEDLYNDGLKRFPGTFAEYHLSPDAIIPDRSQPVLAAGIPTVLFQGILTARILARDWKKAYLALDTILRLYPTQTPSRFFELFISERPISEAYSAFMVACRAGTVLGPGQVTALLTKLRAAMGTTVSMSDRVMILRAVANALYAYQEAGGRLESLHVGVFIHCFEHVLPEQPSNQDFQGEAIHLRNILVLSAHEILGGLLQAGFPAQIHPFEALVSVAGNLRVPDLLTTTIQDIKTAQIDLGPIGTRSALTSAGLVKNQELIKELWSRIVSAANAEGSQIAFEDWITFTRACRRADLGDYFREQLSKLSHTTTSSVEEHLTYQMGLTEKVSNWSSFQYMSVDELAAEIEGLKQQMKNVEAVVMSGLPLDLQNSPFYMHIDPTTTSMSSLENLRAVYDEFTTDPHQPSATPAPEGSPAHYAMSSTKIPFDQLRFMNWLSILEMMAEAESYESNLRSSVNQAISSGKPFKDRPLAFLRRGKHESLQSKQDLRERVKNLRNPKAASPPTIRKMGSATPIITDTSTNYQPTTEQNQAANKAATEVPAYAGRPNLRYYVGMESDHEAPAKLLEQRRLKLERSAIKAGAEDSMVQSTPDGPVIRDSKEEKN